MPLKHDPTVDLITAKPNKQKSISAGKVKEEGGRKRKLDQNDWRWWWWWWGGLQLWEEERGGASGGMYVTNVFSLPNPVDM